MTLGRTDGRKDKSMLKGRRRWLALGALTAVLVVGSSAAIAATRAGDDGFLAGVARRLGITEDRLKDAIRAETLARIDQAEKDGDLTEEQADRLRERARSGETPWRFPGRALPHKPFDPFGLGLGLPGRIVGGAVNQFEAAAKYLGLTQAQLREELEDGDSLADVARQKDKSVDGLKRAMKNALKQDLDEAVEDDAITREQADNLYEKLSDAVDELVEREGGRFGFRLELGPGGPAFGFERGSRAPEILPAIPEVAVHVETDISLA
jgi:hypothetical protein